MYLRFSFVGSNLSNSSFIPVVLSVVTLIKHLLLAKITKNGESSVLTDTYLTCESKRSVIWHFRPTASFSNVQIRGFESALIHECIADFETPDMIESCRIDTFF